MQKANIQMKGGPSHHARGDESHAELGLAECTLIIRFRVKLGDKDLTDARLPDCPKIAPKA